MKTQHRQKLNKLSKVINKETLFVAFTSLPAPNHTSNGVPNISILLSHRHNKSNMFKTEIILSSSLSQSATLPIFLVLIRNPGFFLDSFFSTYLTSKRSSSCVTSTCLNSLNMYHLLQSQYHCSGSCYAICMPRIPEKSHNFPTSRMIPSLVYPPNIARFVFLKM